MKRQSETTTDHGPALLAHAKVLLNQLQQPKIQHMIRQARQFTRLEDTVFVARLKRLVRVIEEALAA